MAEEKPDNEEEKDSEKDKDEESEEKDSKDDATSKDGDAEKSWSLSLPQIRVEEQIQGWVGFAGVLFLVLGLFNMIDGVVALAEDDHFTTGHLFFGDLTMWGAVMIAFGGIQVLTAGLIFNRKTAGQVLGIFLASFNMLSHLLFLPVYPIWSIIIMVIDGLVIYVLTINGAEYTAAAVDE